MPPPYSPPMAMRSSRATFSGSRCSPHGPFSSCEMQPSLPTSSASMRPWGVSHDSERRFAWTQAASVAPLFPPMPTISMPAFAAFASPPARGRLPPPLDTVDAAEIAASAAGSASRRAMPAPPIFLNIMAIVMRRFTSCRHCGARTFVGPTDKSRVAAYVAMQAHVHDLVPQACRKLELKHSPSCPCRVDRSALQPDGDARRSA